MREVFTMWRHTKMPVAPGLTAGRKAAAAAESEGTDA